MKATLILLFLLLISTVYGQNSSKINSIGTIDKIYSKVLNEEREIWIYVPKEYNKDTNSITKYPVIYLLDGNSHFHYLTAIIEFLSRNSVCPKMIVVGILNTNRSRDLTPSPSNSTFDSTLIGGAHNFTKFIENELIPYIESIYPTAPYRTLIGHSFGGLMVLNTLINYGHLFNAYAVIDPSVWWDNQHLLNQIDSVLIKKQFSEALYIGVANTMIQGMDTMQVRKDTSSSTLPIRSMLTLTDKLKANPNNGLRWSYDYYNEDDHGSVPLIAIYDALRFIFDYYKFKGEYNDPKNLISHYDNVSRQIGYKILPPEYTVNNMGYYCMQRKMFEQAHTFFKLNIENYPKSFNVYDSMGEYYEALGNKERAIEYYTLALKIKDFPYTSAKLEKLKAEK